MREIRQSGSEGGEPQPNAASLPLSGIAVEIFDRRRIWIVHHLAMDGYGDCGGGTEKAITTNLRGPHGSLCRE